MKLIDKDALVAEIRNKVDSYRGDGMIYIGVLKQHCEDFIYSLDTLEVKEVDLEKELKILDNTLFDLDGVAVQGATHYLTVEDVKDIAKHFFELGLNSKSISIDFGNIDDILEEDGVDPYSKEARIFKECYHKALDNYLEKHKPQKGE